MLGVSVQQSLVQWLEVPVLYGLLFRVVNYALNPFLTAELKYQRGTSSVVSEDEIYLSLVITGIESWTYGFSLRQINKPHSEKNKHSETEKNGTGK
jgi:hypothetical protein